MKKVSEKRQCQEQSSSLLSLVCNSYELWLPNLVARIAGTLDQTYTSSVW